MTPAWRRAGAFLFDASARGFDAAKPFLGTLVIALAGVLLSIHAFLNDPLAPPPPPRAGVSAPAAATSSTTIELADVSEDSLAAHEAAADEVHRRLSESDMSSPEMLRRAERFDMES